jgi:hypothetical protein
VSLGGRVWTFEGPTYSEGSAKERLKRLTLMALERYENNEAFTLEEVYAYFDALTKAFGPSEASGFLNLVVATIQRHGGARAFNKFNNVFGRALVVTIVESARKKKTSEARGKLK